MNEMDDKNRKNPIAIIAVHGVADQLPFDSARQIAQMLLAHSPSSKNQTSVSLNDQKPSSSQDQQPYKSFTETEFHIPEIPSSYLEPKQESDGILHSLCLKGERVIHSDDGDLEISQPVHIYEMYWADLSRLQNELLRIFSEFYQLLFHLSRIGRRIVEDLYSKEEERFKDFSFLFIKGKKIWDLYKGTQIWAERSLTIGFPLLNLFMFATALTLIPTNIPQTYIEHLPIASALAACSFFILDIKWHHNIRGKLFNLRRASICLGVIISAISSSLFDQWNSYKHLATLSGFILIYIATIIIKRYEKRRPHLENISSIMFIFWMLIYIGALIFSTGEQCQPNLKDHCAVIFACFRTVEISFIPLLLSWLVFHICNVISALLGFYLIKSQRCQNSTIRRGAWTARLSLSLSSGLFLLVTLNLWYAAAIVSQNLIPEEINYNPLLLDSIVGPKVNAREFPLDVITFSSTSLFALVFVALIFVILIGVLAFLPSILSEISPNIYHQKNFSEDKKSLLEMRLENWLTRGLACLYYATNIYAVAIIVFSFISIFILFKPLLQLIPIEQISNFGNSLLDISQNQKLTKYFLDISAIVIVSSATSLVALGSRLARFTTGIRNVLDAALDVDNYLRKNPEENNPKTKIFRRYLSILHYINNWSDPEKPNQKYAAVIIIAHSQGTVISADVLRFLSKDNPTEKENYNFLRLNEQSPNYLKNSFYRYFHSASEEDLLPIYLYTMGSPLKQLYNATFPTLYDWMDDLNNIDQFGLQSWTNVYCSGDYIGRSLWAADKEAPKKFSDYCIGAGAHTHYWDSTFPKVAEKLDDLVQEISK